MGVLLREVAVTYLGSSSLSNENKKFVLEVLTFGQSSLPRPHPGTSQLITRSTRHTIKWCDELTVVSDGVVTS